MSRIACIGLGAMGLPIARHLAARFGTVAAFDVAPSDAALGDSGLRWMDSPAEVGRNADIVFQCLPGEAYSTAAIEGPLGLLSVARAGLTVVELSTLDPQAVRAFGAKFAAAGAGFCDAPLFGAPVDARAGRLAVVISGSREHFDIVHPVALGFARRVTHAGDLGAASLIKVMQNSLGLVQVAAIAEAFAVLEAAGGDPHRFYEAVVGSGGMADSALFAKIGIDFADHQARFGALLRIAAKDIGLGNQLATRSGAPARLIAHTAAQFEAAASAGFGEADLLTVAPSTRPAANGGA